MAEHRRRRGSFLAVALCLAARLAVAAAPDPFLDEHVNRLTSELRCLVCQNQTVADSQAELAMQLKAEVRSQLARGATDQQVRDFMVARYGEFVLYRPTVGRNTWLLWSAPLLLLLAGGITLVLYGRERRAAFQDGEESVWPSADEVQGVKTDTGDARA